jgi:hypothetical protein
VDRRVVDEHVHLRQLRREPLHALRIGHVELRGARTDPLSCGLRLRRVAAGEDGGVPSSGELAGDLKADPAVRAGDHGDHAAF